MTIWDILLLLNCPEDYAVEIKHLKNGEFLIEPIDKLRDNGVKVKG